MAEKQYQISIWWLAIVPQPTVLHLLAIQNTELNAKQEWSIADIRDYHTMDFDDPDEGDDGPDELPW